ncbi:MAG: hypothetical protein QXK80_03595 [Candidatus Pacearchaeota archaeon]
MSKKDEFAEKQWPFKVISQNTENNMWKVVIESDDQNCLSFDNTANLILDELTKIASQKLNLLNVGITHISNIYPVNEKGEFDYGFITGEKKPVKWRRELAFRGFV